MNKPVNFSMTTPTPQQIKEMLEDWPMRITKNHQPVLHCLNAITVRDTITVLMVTAKEVLFSLTRIPAAAITVKNTVTGQVETAYLLVHINNREKLSPYRRQHDAAMNELMPLVDQVSHHVLALPTHTRRCYQNDEMGCLADLPSSSEAERVIKAIRGFVFNQITENNNMVTDGVPVRPTAIYRYPGTSTNVLNVIRNTGLLMSVYPEELKDLFENTYPGALLPLPEKMTGRLVINEKAYKFVLVHAFGDLEKLLRAENLDEPRTRRLAYSLSRIIDSEFPILFANPEALHKMRASITFD